MKMSEAFSKVCPGMSNQSGAKIGAFVSLLTMAMALALMATI